MTSQFRRAWVLAAAAALLALAWVQLSRIDVRHETGMLPIQPSTPYVRYYPPGQTQGRIMVVHGLNSSKDFMQIFSTALAESGFEVYSIDLPGHGSSPIGFEPTAAKAAINGVLDYLGGDTIAVGHSLGAGLLLDIALHRYIKTMVLLSPAPTPVYNLFVGRLLVVTGDWDIPRINAFIPTLENGSDPNVQWMRLAWTAHSSALFNPKHIRAIVEWLGGDAGSLKTTSRMIWLGIMLVTSAVLGIGLLPGSAIVPRRRSSKNIALAYMGACSTAVVVLRFFPVTVWLRLLAMDYMIGLLLITGFAVWIYAGLSPSGELFPRSRNSCRSGILAVAAAAYVIVVMGLVTGSHFFHFTLTDGRWWRFPLIAAASFPLFAMDESLLRPIYPRWKSAGLALVTRVLLGAAGATGALILNPRNALLVLIIHLVVLFWVVLWFAAGVVHRSTQNALATALFAALVQGWFFAALFVTT